MPDSNNRYVKQDLQTALEPAELRINQFDPPASRAPEGTYQVNLPEIQRQVAQKAAQERTDAIFDFLVSLIAQGVGEEIDRRQILQRLARIEERLGIAPTS